MRLTEDQKALAGDPAHIKLATIRAKQFARRHRQMDRYEDYLGAALLGLCDAASRFDPATGFQFATFAKRRIVGAMLDHRRELMTCGFGSGRACIAEGSFVKPVALRAVGAGLDGEREDSMEGQYPDGSPPVGWEVESEEAVRAVAGRLKGAAREVVVAYFLDAACEGTLRLVAAKVGVSESRASQCLTLAAQQLGGKARAGLRALRSAGGL